MGPAAYRVRVAVTVPLVMRLPEEPVNMLPVLTPDKVPQHKAWLKA